MSPQISMKPFNGFFFENHNHPSRPALEGGLGEIHRDFIGKEKGDAAQQRTSGHSSLSQMQGGDFLKPSRGWFDLQIVSIGLPDQR